MEDEEPLTYWCKKCGTLIYYTPYEVRENKQWGPVANCPKCGAFRRCKRPPSSPAHVLVAARDLLQHREH